MFVEIYRAARNTGVDLKKKTLHSLKGISQLFACDFHSNLNETNADMVEFTKR